MKTKIFAALVLVILVSGCARFAPNMISADVYSSSRNAVVEENKADKEQFSTKIMGEINSRARAEARQQIALEEIKNGTAGEIKGGKKTLTADGILGGFPAIIINDSACAVSGKITQIGGDYAGTVWSFDIKANGGIKEMALESRDFAVKWSYPPSEITHPRPGEGDYVMSVHNTVRYLDDRTKKQYHGAYRIKGSGCY